MTGAMVSALDRPAAAHRRGEPALDDILEYSLRVTLAILGQQQRATAVAQLIDYYAIDSDNVGGSFLDGSEVVDVDTVTAADLHAITMLGLRVRPRFARLLLFDTPIALRVARCLDPRRLPIDASLDETRGLVVAMQELYESIAAAVAASGAVSAAPLVAALCARKRPQLFAIHDPQVCRLLGMAPDVRPRLHWQVFAHLLRDDAIASALATIMSAVRASGEHVRADPYPLHHLHVLLRTFADAQPGTNRDLPIANNPRWYGCSD